MSILTFAPSTPLPSNSRIIYKVERTLRRGANVPRMEYDKSKIEKYKLEIQQILNTLDTPSSLLDGNSGIDKRAPRSLSVDPYNSTAMISASKCGKSRPRSTEPMWNAPSLMLLALLSP